MGFELFIGFFFLASFAANYTIWRIQTMHDGGLLVALRAWAMTICMGKKRQDH